MDSVDVRVHVCLASFLDKQHVLKMSSLARSFLTDWDRMRQPWIDKGRKRREWRRLVAFLRFLPYMYIRAVPGGSLTAADRQANAAATVTFKSVCKTWSRELSFGYPRLD